MKSFLKRWVHGARPTPMLPSSCGDRSTVTCNAGETRTNTVRPCASTVDACNTPLQVPFRLTRMMIKAMEVSGIEGNFRSTCEETIRVLRANKESVIAMLEAFVHDPLINWRLLNTAEVPCGAVLLRISTSGTGGVARHSLTYADTESSCCRVFHVLCT